MSYILYREFGRSAHGERHSELWSTNVRMVAVSLVKLFALAAASVIGADSISFHENPDVLEQDKPDMFPTSSRERLDLRFVPFGAQM